MRLSMNLLKSSCWQFILNFCLLCGMTLSYTSCNDEDGIVGDPYLTIEGDQTSFEGSSAKAEYKITIRSNMAWRVVSKTENSDWVRAFPDEGDKDGYFRLIVSANKEFQDRRAEFAIVGEDGSEYPLLLSVSQEASVPTITIGDGTGVLKVGSTGGQTAVTTSSNVEWECSVDAQSASWLKLDSISAKGMMYVSTLKNKGTERIGILHCTSSEQPSANIDIQVIQASGSIILQEDFSWLAYGSATHWDTTGETRYDKWTDDEKAHGWTSTLLSDGTPCLYARQGFVKLGKTNYAGDLISPKLQIEEATADVKVVFKACAYISSGGTKDNNELYVSVIGPGTVEVNNPLIIDNYPNSKSMEQGADYDVWAPAIAERSFIIRGVTSDTQIKFMGGDSYDLNGRPGTDNRNRIFLDDIVVSYYLE